MVEFHELTQYQSYLNDESNIVTNGNADRIYFPQNESEVQEIVKNANQSSTPVTISGGGTGISGGRVPQSGWLIATDKMNVIEGISELWTDPETKNEYHLLLKEIDSDTAVLTVPVSITVKAVQNYVREKGWFYPPDPTERTSYLGGNVSTNASGARTFKYSATRKWIHGLHIVLPDGELIELSRDQDNGKISSEAIFLKTNHTVLEIPRPKYILPKVTKHVAGPVIDDSSHPLDLFIGSNGIFGFVTQVTLRLIRPPIQIYSIFTYCDSSEQAFDLIRACQKQRREQSSPIPLSVEFFDERATIILRDKEPRVNKGIKAVVMLEQDVYSEEELEKSLDFYNNLFTSLGIEDSDVALTYAENEHHKFLRHWVAEYVIGLNRTFGQSLIVSDYSVPESNFKEFFDFLIATGEKYVSYLIQRKELGEGNPGYTLFGHVGDCHPHLTLLPRDDEEAKYAMALLVEVVEKTVGLGGSIASEHGLGKKHFGDKIAFWYQYGDQGIEDVKKMKNVIDPQNLLCPNNLIFM